MGMNRQFLLLAGILGLIALGISESFVWIDPNADPVKKAQTVAIGDNVYVVWFTDNGMLNANSEVLFRVSNGGGATFGEKINLSNSTDADSKMQKFQQMQKLLQQHGESQS